MKRGPIYCLLAALAVMPQACGTFQTPAKQVKLYVLAYPCPDAVQSAQTLPVRLAVRSLRADAPYRSEQIIYADSKYRRSAYVYHKWAAPPAHMLTDLIVRDIRAARIVEVVFPDTGREPTHILEGTVEAFYEDDTTNPWEAVLSMTLTLAGNTPGSAGSPVLLHKTYRIRTPLEQNNPLGLAKAMSQAVQAASAQLVPDIQSRLAE